MPGEVRNGGEPSMTPNTKSSRGLRLHFAAALLIGTASAALLATPAEAQVSAASLRGTITDNGERSEEHTSELQSLMRISYAVFCLKQKKKTKNTQHQTLHHQSPQAT